MIAAFDVHYFGDGSASAAAVLFHDYKDAEPTAEYTGLSGGIEEYVPGQFYRRELPCILDLFRLFAEVPDTMIIDGYVMLGDRPGLGQYLFESLRGTIPVIGVAKSKFRGSAGIEIFRGNSRRPLYVTSAGLDIGEASENIRTMHGAHRVPDLLKRVDFLARAKAGAFENVGAGKPSSNVTSMGALRCGGGRMNSERRTVCRRTSPVPCR